LPDVFCGTYQNGEQNTKKHKIIKMAINIPSSHKILKGHEICHKPPFQGLLKYTKIRMQVCIPSGNS
jgi:hypothetical protein